MKMKRIISLVIVLLLVCGMPVSAFAEEYDLSVGSITVNASESGQTVSQDNGVQDYQETTPTVITQSSSTPTTNTVTINAAENATANVTIQDVNIVISTSKDDSHNYEDEAAVTVNVADNAVANVTLDGVKIDTEKTGGVSVTDPTGFTKMTHGIAAVQIKGSGDVTLELDGENTVQSGDSRAGVEKNDSAGTGSLTITDETGTSGSLNTTGGAFGAGIGGGEGGSGSNITISGGDVEATGGQFGAGIGGGLGGSGSNITITGSAEVTATGGQNGSGIGGGLEGSGNNITISEDAHVKVQGGIGGYNAGAGAAIGNGGKFNSAGTEVEPNTDELTPNGKIEYYAPGANMENDNPIKTVIGTYVPPQDEEKPPVDEEKPDRPSQPSGESADEEACYAPLYRVINQDGKDIPHQAERKDGVLTLTVDVDFASLTGSLGGINALKEQGIDTIVFVTNGVSSTFALADLLAQGSTGDSYTLNHNGAAVSFTLDNGADLGKIMSSRI